MFNTLLDTTEAAENGIDWGALLDKIVSTVTGWCLNVGIKLLVGLVVMLIAFKVINKITRRIEKKGEKDKYDKTLMRTIAYLLRISLKVIVAVCFVAFVGFDISGITALIASFGVAIGLAVNGALANIAGGVLILVTRPFKVDDFIEAQGVSGTVEDIHMVSTKLRTPDNKVIYIPNGALANGNIVNYSVKDIRRVDFSFSISYESDCEKAKSLVMDILTAHELTLDDPAPFVRMSAHADNAITITARVWSKSGDYWTVNFDVLEAVKAAFDANGIVIPYNQLDVHVKNS